MRDTKSLSLLLLSSVLFLLSIILLCTWGYQYYHQIQQDKTKEQKPTASTTLAVPDATRDSLLKIYKLTLSSLGNAVDTAWYHADSLKGNLDINLKEFYRLRDEIAALLQAKVPNTDDVNLARKKITELQLRVDQLRYRNLDVENENKRLKALLSQIAKDKQAGLDVNARQTVTDEPPSIGKVNSFVPNITLSAVNLSLSALANNSQDETNEAKLTEKLVGSFVIKNTSSINTKTDIVIVVLQPNGQVLQKSDWESGVFETKEGKKVYSCKLRCEASKGESRQLNFSITADKYLKGNYSMQIYHKGVLIGRMYKSLS